MLIFLFYQWLFYVKFTRIKIYEFLNRNVVPSISPLRTFFKVKSKQSSLYGVFKRSAAKPLPFARPSYASVDVDVNKKDSIKRRRNKTVDRLSVSHLSQVLLTLPFVELFQFLVLVS